MTPSALVTHPGRQHSHQLVQALHTHSMLAGYWTGVPARPLTTRPLLRPLARLLEKHPLLPIPDEKVQHCLIEPLVRRVTAWLPASIRTDWSHRAMGQFDRWCARRLEKVDATAVVAYENAALHTFQRAHELNRITILDAASFHHVWQDDVYDYAESATVHAGINTRKDAEIEAADHILTVSELARQSYIEGGVLPEKVTAVPVGCDLERFQQADCDPHAEKPSLEDRPFTFIFAGHAGHRKGIDLLLEAASRLSETHPSVQIWIAGGADDTVAWETAPQVERLGRLPQPELATRFQEADCLVLPSRHDSFGMVVVEAMATGLPVIITENVGAKEAITEGKSGWVIPAEDSTALYDRMRWCIDHADQVRAMQDAARRDAKPYSWEAYRKRVVHVLNAIIERNDR